MVTFAAGVITGLLLAIIAYVVLRRELDLYHRTRGVMVDFTHRSRS